MMISNDQGKQRMCLTLKAIQRCDIVAVHSGSIDCLLSEAHLLFSPHRVHLA